MQSGIGAAKITRPLLQVKRKKMFSSRCWDASDSRKKAANCKCLTKYTEASDIGGISLFSQINTCYSVTNTSRLNAIYSSAEVDCFRLIYDFQ